MNNQSSTVHKRVVGIDYGTKRVGVAVSDPLHLFATPVGTFTPGEALLEIKRIHEIKALGAIVIGWPLTEKGEEKKATLRVQEYINRLAKAFPSIPVHKVDERYSSRRATAALVNAGVSKKARRQKGRIDSAAAAVILQDYLDEHS